MKRPLCVLALVLTAAVLLYLWFFYDDIEKRYLCPEPDGSTTEITGRVMSRELTKSYTGEMRSVIYLAPTGSDSMIQCYMEESGAVEKASDDCSLAPAIGTYVKVRGRVSIFSKPSNPGEFDSRLYYNTRKISYRLMDAEVLAAGGRPDVYRELLQSLKETLGACLDAALYDEDAGTMKAMLLGDKSGLDQEIRDLYKSGGIYHIICISGTHIALLGMGLYRLLRRILRKCGRAMDWVAAAFAVLAMYSYGIMCGSGNSAVRAICMFGLRLLAPLLGRTYDVLSALALAEILLILEQPLYLYDSGFLMSFSAVIGIVVVRPCLGMLFLQKGQEMRFVDDEKSILENLGGTVAEGLLASVAIGITTLPVYALFYHTYPLHSLVINLLVIPALGVLLALGAGCMVLGVGCMALGGLCLTPGAVCKVAMMDTLFRAIEAVVAFLVHIILFGYRWLCSLRGVNASLTWYMGHSEGWQVAVYVAMLCGFVVMTGKCASSLQMCTVKNRILSSPLRADMARYAILLAAVLILTFRNDPELSVHMVDVGQGDAIVVSSGGRNLLIDGGSTSEKNVGKYRIIPFLKYQGIGVLDGVVVTHEDDDHISGVLEIMDAMEIGGIQIKKLILPEIAGDFRGENYHVLERRAAELGIPVLYINSGESFALGKASLTCINPVRGMETSEANAYSTVLYLRYGEFTALFTGDMEGDGLENVKEELRELKADQLRGNGAKAGITLLKVAHHGSRYTTDEEFLELTRPKLALISCGRKNTYGHPHKELLERLEQAGSKVYRTDIGGCVAVEIHGNAINVREYCK